MPKLEPGQLSPQMDRELDGLQPTTKDEFRELLRRARAGDIEARNEMVERNLPLIRFLLRKYYRNWDENDAMQDCAVYMLGRYMDYDESRGSLSTFTKNCMDAVFSAEKRKNGADKRSRETVAMDVEAMDRHVEPANPEHYNGDLRQYLLDVVNKMGSNPNPYDSYRARGRAARVLIMLYGLDGSEPMGSPQAAKIMGCTKQMVNQLKFLGLEELRKMDCAKELLEYLRED